MKADVTSARTTSSARIDAHFSEPSAKLARSNSTLPCAEGASGDGSPATQVMGTLPPPPLRSSASATRPGGVVVEAQSPVMQIAVVARSGEIRDNRMEADAWPLGDLQQRPPHDPSMASCQFTPDSGPSAALSFSLPLQRRGQALTGWQGSSPSSSGGLLRSARNSSAAVPRRRPSRGSGQPARLSGG
jgi:hypothetical protein